ncbi:MAG: HAMP domain-containing protein [Candidatus Eisenbacteria bacterium]|nr:HAMP domain-containing protein [Candidatus Eisenbacteria bacterium]
MRRRRLLWHLFPGYLLITVVAVVAVSVYSGLSLRHFYYQQTISTLEARASLLAERAGPGFPSVARPELDALIGELSDLSDTRITLVAPSGRVVADSHEDASGMENHADRPEIAAAMTGQIGSSTRFSHTLGRELVYVAIPVVAEGDITGVVRTALPRTALDRELAIVFGRISFAAALLILLAAGLSLFVSRRITEPIESMRSAAERFARGDFRHNVTSARSEELAGLADSLNRMAAELDVRIRTITHQRAEQEAVLASMVEGVIAVDPEECVIAVNRAASSMLNVEPEASRGRPIQEAIRNTHVQEFAALALSSEGPVEREFVLAAGEERFVQAHGTALRDENGRQVGAVIVINDVTGMRRLENVRKDFVANVSHELRTPITSIKGFVETLIDDPGRSAADTERFLRIIARHADRLDAIIEDLLFLSRIEHGTPPSGEDFRVIPLSRVVRAAVEAVRASARSSRTRVVVNCPDEVSASANPQLLEHAVVNILDNAVKYSPEGSEVVVSCHDEGSEVLVRVEDEGPGIPAADLPRIFERFYRVDKARSREMGGTGLGLAIAKHIVQAHRGRITVESHPGAGSVFCIRLPRPAP